MIQNFVRHCTRTIYQQKITTLINLNTKYYFSTENTQQTEQKEQRQPRQSRQREASDFSPIDYYRNTIRRVNIRSNGRGKFTPYFLQKLINMSTTEEHAKVMYEAYYNYMGHFTVIPNNIVDELVFKSITIGGQVNNVLEIFANHNYLAYFPHYDATNRFIKHLALIKDNENLEKILRVLIRSPLIKINEKIVNQLVELGSNVETEANVREFLLKVLVYRRKLVDGLSQEHVLAKVSKMLESAEFGPFEAKPKITAVIEEIIAEPIVSQEDTVNKLLLASTFSMVGNCATIITQDQQEITTQYDRFFDYLIKLAPRTAEEVDFGTVLKEALSEAKLSLGATEKIEQIVNAKTSAEQTE